MTTRNRHKVASEEKGLDYHAFRGRRNLVDLLMRDFDTFAKVDELQGDPSADLDDEAECEVKGLDRIKEFILSLPKYLKPVISKLEELGCDIRFVKNKHVKVYIDAPGGKFVWTAPTTPGGNRSIMNSLGDLKRDLRKFGVEPPRFAMRTSRGKQGEFERLYRLIESLEEECASTISDEDEQG